MTDIIEHIKGVQQQHAKNLQKLDPFAMLEDELYTALSLYTGQKLPIFSKGAASIFLILVRIFSH